MGDGRADDTALSDDDNACAVGEICHVRVLSHQEPGGAGAQRHDIRADFSPPAAAKISRSDAYDSRTQRRSSSSAGVFGRHRGLLGDAALDAMTTPTEVILIQSFMQLQAWNTFVIPGWQSGWNFHANVAVIV